ncbi:MAG: PspC domain-containing protein [Candidatus Saccharimonadales bacterium]
MAEPTKLLRRLPQQGQIAGVCAGIAEYISMDVTLVRVIFIILAIITGGGFILVYILLAIVMPSAEVKTPSKDTDIAQNVKVLADDMRGSKQQSRMRNFLGFGLVLLGTWLFLGQLYPSWIDRIWYYAWPIVLILLGIFIATRRTSDER